MNEDFLNPEEIDEQRVISSIFNYYRNCQKNNNSSNTNNNLQNFIDGVLRNLSQQDNNQHINVDEFEKFIKNSIINNAVYLSPAIADKFKKANQKHTSTNCSYEEKLEYCKDTLNSFIKDTINHCGTILSTILQFNLNDGNLIKGNEGFEEEEEFEEEEFEEKEEFEEEEEFEEKEEFEKKKLAEVNTKFRNLIISKVHDASKDLEIIKNAIHNPLCTLTTHNFKHVCFRINNIEVANFQAVLNLAHKTNKIISSMAYSEFFYNYFIDFLYKNNVSNEIINNIINNQYFKLENAQDNKFVPFSRCKYYALCDIFDTQNISATVINKILNMYANSVSFGEIALVAIADNKNNLFKNEQILSTLIKYFNESSFLKGVSIDKNTKTLQFSLNNNLRISTNIKTELDKTIKNNVNKIFKLMNETIADYSSNKKLDRKSDNFKKVTKLFTNICNFLSFDEKISEKYNNVIKETERRISNLANGIQIQKNIN